MKKYFSLFSQYARIGEIRSFPLSLKRNPKKNATISFEADHISSKALARPAKDGVFGECTPEQTVDLSRGECVCTGTPDILRFSKTQMTNTT